MTCLSSSGTSSFQSPLPLREGGRGRGLSIEGFGPASSVTICGANPLPLAPSREGRGDKKGMCRR